MCDLWTHRLVWHGTFTSRRRSWQTVFVSFLSFLLFSISSFWCPFLIYSVLSRVCRPRPLCFLSVLFKFKGSRQTQRGEAGVYSRIACTSLSRSGALFGQRDLVCLGTWNRNLNHSAGWKGRCKQNMSGFNINLFHSLLKKSLSSFLSSFIKYPNKRYNSPSLWGRPRMRYRRRGVRGKC